VRWIAPVLSFTAEEIWKELPGEREDSVFMATWHQGLFALQDAGERERWRRLMAVREEVSRCIEALRKAGDVGSSLEAEVEIWADEDLMPALSWLGDELRFIMITSGCRLDALADAPLDATRIEVDGNDIAVRIKATTDPKCVRCWHRRPDVGEHAEHPELCGRCVENVAGPGETRRIG
jgi:isoleucyl-tRNA synthetase